MAHDAASSLQLDHSSSMLDFLKGTLKEVPRPTFLICVGQLCCSSIVLYTLLCPSRGHGRSSTTLAMLLEEDLSPTNLLTVAPSAGGGSRSA